ncbi:MAG: DNA repair protein RecN [Desulfobacteraceae bacterium]|jgi:DNA repair protein RecN (Recombination protein N)
MLTHLSIRNFAIIRELETRFRPGLNILSGETGAGKSILVNAVNLILGGRASSDLIRTGTEEARVEAQFHLPDPSPISETLSELGIPFDGDVLISRTLSREGRNAVRINGVLATLQMLSQVTPRIISVSGQHEHQQLLRPEQHLLLLDAFAGLDADRLDLGERFSDYRALRSRLDRIEKEIREQEEKRELARFHLQEIQSARVEPGEDGRLEEERTRLRHAGELRETVGEAYQTVYEKEGAVLSEVARLERRLERAAELDARLGPVREALFSVRAELEDAALQLREIRNAIPMDPQRLERVEERLQLLKRLKRKHGPELEDVIRTGERLAGDMDDLEGKRQKRDTLRAECGVIEQELIARAASLSEKRKAAGTRLARAVEKELGLLAMEGTRLQVHFQEGVPEEGVGREEVMGRLGPEGFDRVEFLLSPNVGEDLRSLSRIASGGELSRILLALKTILTGNASVETVVFDEVDAGIGGATAEVVGEKIEALALQRQVLCITHLPQIASKGGTHFLVQKDVREERTEAEITELDPSARVEEIARLLGGKGLSEKAVAHAREMLERGKGATVSLESPDPP